MVIGKRTTVLRLLRHLSQLDRFAHRHVKSPCVIRTKKKLCYPRQRFARPRDNRQINATRPKCAALAAHPTTRPLARNRSSRTPRVVILQRTTVLRLLRHLPQLDRHIRSHLKSPCVIRTKNSSAIRVSDFKLRASRCNRQINAMHQAQNCWRHSISDAQSKAARRCKALAEQPYRMRVSDPASLGAPL